MPDTKYRYRLTRQWDDTKPRLTIIMLNPSTADDKVDDPTIRRCIGFAKAHQFGSMLVVVNLYACRVAKPRDLWKLPLDTRFDNKNSDVLGVAIESSADILLAWGASCHPDAEWSIAVTNSALESKARLWDLGVTKDGFPRHPLMVRADQPFINHRGRYDRGWYPCRVRSLRSGG